MDVLLPTPSGTPNPNIDLGVRKYGLELHEATHLSKLSDRCWICQGIEIQHFDTKRPGLVRTLVWDHDHSCCDPYDAKGNHRKRVCGRCVRGVACNSCNGRLGKYQELLGAGYPAEVLSVILHPDSRAARYLGRYEEARIADTYPEPEPWTLTHPLTTRSGADPFGRCS